ncbi:MAG: hypothetical protein FJ280_02500 [Planctomycetes bacterium]|nr:hypothetical protein [Planctomycetota bacterium]
MAGMFYSLKEAAQRLGKTEDQVKQLAKDGKLREFRDGSNLLFKIEEVNALLAEGIDITADDLELQELTVEEPAEALGDTAGAVSESVGDDLFAPDEEAAPALEAVESAEEASDLDFLLEDSPSAVTEPQAEESGGIEPEEALPAAEAAAEDLFLAEDLESPAAEEPLLVDEAEGSSEEISLAQESGVLADGSDISDMDTALTGEGISVLGETDTDYDVTEDSMAETAGPAAATGTSAEASLEEIEDDVSLDSFGSGSGLLDLSLQADDTSLGGILDEIYTSEGGEDATPVEGEAVEVGKEASFDEITAEADHAPAEEEAAVPEPVAVMPATLAPAYAEMAPDAQSNILGMLLFLPLVVLLYTAIVAVAGLRHVTPGILSSVQGLIWYLAGGGIVLALIVFGASFMAGREKAPRAAKPARDKKAKAEKPQKEKAAKAQKPAREASAKPAKEKKSLFGKKKK